MRQCVPFIDWHAVRPTITSSASLRSRAPELGLGDQAVLIKLEEDRVGAAQMEENAVDAAGFLTNEAWREEHLRAAEALASNCDGDSLWELAGLTFIDWHAVRPTITRVHDDTTETVSLPAVPRGPP